MRWMRVAWPLESFVSLPASHHAAGCAMRCMRMPHAPWAAMLAVLHSDSLQLAWMRLAAMVEHAPTQPCMPCSTFLQGHAALGAAGCSGGGTRGHRSQHAVRTHAMPLPGAPGRSASACHG